MAYDDDFNQEGEGEEGGIVLFGTTLSPTILAAVLALAGLGLSVYLGLNYVKPVWEESEKLTAEINQKKDQLRQAGEIQKQIDTAQVELAKVKGVQNIVLGMFSNPSNLSTLALDLDREIRNRNAQLTTQSIRDRLQACPPAVLQNYAEIQEKVENFFAEAKMTRFTPVLLDKAKSQTQGTTPSEDGYEMVKDDSLGSAANNQVKRQVYDVALQGNFDQVLVTLRRLEQLQPLIVLTEMNAEVEKIPVLVDAKGPLATCQPEMTIQAQFKAQAILPLSEEELAAQQAPPTEEGADKDKKEGDAKK
jgi:type IV pilus assembly protein PilO